MTEKTLDVKVGGPLADLLHDMAFALTTLLEANAMPVKAQQVRDTYHRATGSWLGDYAEKESK